MYVDTDSSGILQDISPFGAAAQKRAKGSKKGEKKGNQHEASKMDARKEGIKIESKRNRLTVKCK